MTHSTKQARSLALDKKAALDIARFNPWVPLSAASARNNHMGFENCGQLLKSNSSSKFDSSFTCHFPTLVLRPTMCSDGFQA
jgi:hypothetical protein